MTTEAQLVAQRDVLNERIEQIRKNRSLTCGYCGRRTKLSKLTAYLPLYRDIDSDCHWDGGDIQVICPKCNMRIRYLKGSSKDFEFLNDHKYYMARVVESENIDKLTIGMEWRNTK